MFISVINRKSNS